MNLISVLHVGPFDTSGILKRVQLRQVGLEQEFHVVEGTTTPSLGFVGAGTIVNSHEALRLLTETGARSKIIRNLDRLYGSAGMDSVDRAGNFHSDGGMVEVRTRPHRDVQNLSHELKLVRAGLNAVCREMELSPLALGMFANSHQKTTVLDPRGSYPIGERASVQVNVERLPEDPEKADVLKEINQNLVPMLLVGQSLFADLHGEPTSQIGGSWRAKYELVIKSEGNLNAVVKNGRHGSTRYEIRVADSLANIADIQVLSAMGRAIVERSILVVNGLVPTNEPGVTMRATALGNVTPEERSTELSKFVANHSKLLEASGDLSFVTRRLSWISKFGAESDANRRVYSGGQYLSGSGSRSLVSYVAECTAAGSRPLERASVLASSFCSGGLSDG